MANLINNVTEQVMIGEISTAPIESGFETLTVEQIYNSWAAELGLDPTGSDVGGMTGDDTFVRIPLPFPPIYGGQPFIGWDSEGNISFYADEEPNTDKRMHAFNFLDNEFAFNNRNRAYTAGNTLPPLVMSLSYALADDGESEIANRVRSSAQGAILFGRWNSRGDSNQYSVMALRINPNLTWNIYAQMFGTSAGLGLFSIDTRQPTSRSQVYTNGSLAGTKFFDMEVATSTIDKVRFVTAELSMGGNFQITGTVTLDGQPFRSRLVVTSVEDTPRVVGTGSSDAFGDYTIPTGSWGGAVLINSIQDYGSEWESETAIVVDQYVHPTTPNGYIYKVQSAGVTGTTEPEWPTSSGVNVIDGGVSYESETLLKPMIEGYVTPTEV